MSAIFKNLLEHFICTLLRHFWCNLLGGFFCSFIEIWYTLAVFKTTHHSWTKIFTTFRTSIWPQLLLRARLHFLFDRQFIKLILFRGISIRCAERCAKSESQGLLAVSLVVNFRFFCSSTLKNWPQGMRSDSIDRGNSG